MTRHGVYRWLACLVLLALGAGFVSVSLPEGTELPSYFDGDGDDAAVVKEIVAVPALAIALGEPGPRLVPEVEIRVDREPVLPRHDRPRRAAPSRAPPA